MCGREWLTGFLRDFHQEEWGLAMAKQYKQLTCRDAGADCDFLVRAETELEPAHAIGRPGRRANLGRIVRERAYVIPDHRRRARELRSRQLHPVSGIPGKTDNYFFF